MGSPQSHAREVFRNEHWVLERDDKNKLFFARRTPQPQPTANEIETSFRQLEAAMDAQGRSAHSLLIDFSKGPAPARRDPTFEAVVDKHVDGFTRGFVKVASLTLTQSGRVQVERYFREHGKSVEVFLDEEAAVASLLSPGH